MTHRNPPNYTALADHILVELDRWEDGGAGLHQPNGRVLGVAGLIAICFGPDSAEAIAFDLITSLEEFNDVQEEARGVVTREEQTAYLAGLLRQEFSEQFP